MAGRGRRPGPRGPPRRDHRADRPEDDDQRAELGCEGLARRPGGRHEPHLEERHRGPAVAARRDPGRAPPSPAPRARSTEVTADRDAHDRDAPARLAPDRAAHPLHRPLRPDDVGIRLARRLRAVLLPQRRAADRERPWPVLLPRQARIERGGEAVGRRLHVQRAVHRHPARHDPRDRADRDAARGVRDGGDPLRAARPLRRPQRRPLGLHLLDHQELPRPRGAVRAARPQRGHDDRAVHAGLHRAAREDLPQAGRLRDRRHERLHPEPARSRGHRSGRSRRSPPTRSARPATASTARGWRTPT